MNTMTQFESESLATAAAGDFSFREVFYDRASGRTVTTEWTFDVSAGYAVLARKYRA